MCNVPQCVYLPIEWFKALVDVYPYDWSIVIQRKWKHWFAVQGGVVGVNRIHYWIWDDLWEDGMSEIIIWSFEIMVAFICSPGVVVDATQNLELTFDIGIYSDRWIYLVLVPVPYDLN